MTLVLLVPSFFVVTSPSLRPQLFRRFMSLFDLLTSVVGVGVWYFPFDCTSPSADRVNLLGSALTKRNGKGKGKTNQPKCIHIQPYNNE